MHSFADAFCARSSAKYQVQLRTIPRGQSQMVGSWEVVIATLHTDLVHNLLVPLMSYVSIKPSSRIYGKYVYTPYLAHDPPYMPTLHADTAISSLTWTVVLPIGARPHIPCN